MRVLSEILANVEQMDIRELEAHIIERRQAMDKLRAENRALTPHRDQKWAKHFRDTAGPQSLQRVLNVGDKK